MNNTRKDFLKGMTGLASILACHKAPAFVKSMLGARSSVTAMTEPTEVIGADAYIQDGLLHMWDGIENAEWGLHDNNSLIWQDLVGDITASVNDGIWSKNAFTLTSSSSNEVIGAFLQNYETAYWSTANEPFTIEICIDLRGMRDWGTWDPAYVCIMPQFKMKFNRNTITLSNSGLTYYCNLYTTSTFIMSYTGVKPYSGHTCDGLITISFPFKYTDIWHERVTKFCEYLTINGLRGTKNYQNTSGDSNQTMCIGVLPAGNCGTMKIHRISIYQGLDNDRSDYNYQIDKARFDLP